MNRLAPMLSILNDTRKTKLVRGLRKRLTDHRGILESLSQRLAMEKQIVEQAFQQSSAQLALDFQLESDRAFNAWDTNREDVYQQSDRVTFASLQSETKRLQELKDAYQRARKLEISTNQQAKLSLDQQYEELKPKPGKQLERYVSVLASRRSEADEFIDQFRSVMIDRSIAIPTLQPSDVQCKEAIPDSIQSSMEAIQSNLESMKRILNSTQRDFFVRLSGSIAPWLIGIAPGIIVGFLLWKFLSDQTYLAIGITLATLLIVPISLVLALLPRVKRRMTIPYIELIRESEHLIAVSKNGQRLAETHCRQEQSRLLTEYRGRVKKREDEHCSTLEQLETRYSEDQASLRNQQSELRRKTALECIQQIQSTDQKHSPKTVQLVATQKQQLNQHDQAHAARQLVMEQQQSNLLDRLQMRVRTGTGRAQKWLDKMQQSFHQRFPAWDSEIWRQGNWPRFKNATHFPIGSCNLTIPPDFQSRLLIGFDLLTHGSLVIEADHEHRVQTNGLVQSLLARAFTSLPMGNLHCTIIDPEGLGKDFAWLMQLADADPRLVSHRIWTQHTQIAEQLSMLAYQNEEIIQQRLRDRYSNILEYNDDAGPMAEPIRLVVWSNFPFGLDETSWKSLCSLLASGARCGIGLILTVDPNHAWPVFADRAKIFQAGLHLKLTDTAHVVAPELQDLELQIDPVPSPNRLTTIIEHCTATAMQAGKIEVPFDTLAITDIEVGSHSTSDQLVIPLGVAGVGRTTSLRLGHGTSQHVLVAGKTGSGKSSLLHTLITSAALKYAPDQLRMVLLDFKKGVEFQIYAQNQLPHAEIIGIESRREFGLSALEYLDRVMQRRGEFFRQAGVQDIPSWTRVKPDQKMPRVLVVIDEFQEMFVEDDKLAQQTAMLLDRVVRQGRSFGIHMVLASQTLGGSYSLPRTTLAQMAVRIALQCDGADAMMILGEDNLAATRLRHSGQAIYNDAGGRIESNQPFQVAFLTSQTHSEQLARIPISNRPNDPSTNLLGRQIIFEGHKPAAWNASDVLRGIEAMPKFETGSLRLILGESLSIEPTVTRSLARQAGRNMVIVGSDDALAANLLCTIVRGWLLVHASIRCPLIYFLDGTRAEDQHSSSIGTWLTSPTFADPSRTDTPAPILADAKGADTMISKLYSELEQRLLDSESSHQDIVLVIANLGRFRELRRTDEFSFGGSSDSEKPATDAAFAKILREGPSVGMRVICWVDSWGTLSRFVPRQGLRDIEIKALMQMSSNDSNQLIDASAANKLEPHAMIFYDEIDGKIVKFRPYQKT